MKFNNIFYIFFIFFLYFENVSSDEIKFNSTNIKILEEGNIVTALNVEANIPDKKIKIEGDKSIYDKKNTNLTIINNVKFFDLLQDFYLESSKVIYDQSKDILQTFGETFIKIENKYFL